MPETQLSLNLTDEIRQLHQKAFETLLDAVAIAVKIGEKLIEADNVPGFDFSALPFDAAQGKRYRNAYNRRHEIEQHPELMLELLSLPEVRKRMEAIAGPHVVWAEFLKPISTLKQWVRKRLGESAIDDWPPIYKNALRDQLKPLVELYEQL